MHNRKLTAIRGIACLIVAICHPIYMFNASATIDDYAVPFGSHGGWGTFHQVMMMAFNGEGAVVVFFVLSSCVLSIQMDRLVSASPVPIWTFYERRVFRIYPMIICSVLMAAVVLGTIQHFPDVHAMPLSVASYIDQTVSKSDLIKNLIAWRTDVNPTLWSMKIELYLSVAFPAIYYVSKHPRIYIGLAILSAIVLFSDQIGHVTLRRSVLAFVVGAAIPRYRWLGRSLGMAEMPVLLISIATLMVARRTLLPLGFNVGAYVLPETIAAFLIVRATYFGTVKLGLLDWRPLQFLGEISYSYYVLHYPVLWAMILALWGVAGAAFPLAHPLAADAVLALLTVSLTFPLSLLTYRTIEMPFHRWGQRRARAKLA